MSVVLAYHFCREDNRLGYSDGRAVRVGDTLSVDPPIMLCRHGLHGSERIIDALEYAPGPILCRTEHSGEIVRGDDKLASQRRRVIARVDATYMLRVFSRWSALGVVHLWDCPGIVVRYLLTGDESIRDAARVTVGVAAGVAAWDAARVTAWAAAWAAAGDAARDAAWAATWAAANQQLTAMAERLLATGEVEWQLTPYKLEARQ
jgi:hypothetical protein